MRTLLRVAPLVCSLRNKEGIDVLEDLESLDGALTPMRPIRKSEFKSSKMKNSPDDEVSWGSILVDSNIVINLPYKAPFQMGRAVGIQDFYQGNFYLS